MSKEKITASPRLIYLRLFRRSPLTGELRGRILEVRARDAMAWLKGQLLIQHAFPYLSSEDREWMISGLSREEQNYLDDCAEMRVVDQRGDKK